MDEIITAVDDVVADVAGADRLPVQARTFTTRCSGGSLMLPWRYVSVASVTVDGVLVDAARYDDVTGAQTGVVRPALGAAAPWSSGAVVEVVAQVGVASVSAGVRQAAMFLAGHLWQILQQGGLGAYADEIAGMSAGYAIPNRVRELLQLDGGTLPGFA